VGFGRVGSATHGSSYVTLGVCERLKVKASVSTTGLSGRGLDIDEAEVVRLCLWRRAWLEERELAMVDYWGAGVMACQHVNSRMVHGITKPAWLRRQEVRESRIGDEPLIARRRQRGDSSGDVGILAVSWRGWIRGGQQSTMAASNSRGAGLPRVLRW
jgi:hypothetical protein